jgi:phage shock protein A
MQTKDQRIEFLERELDRAMSNLARIARESHRFKRGFNREYERCRRLENKIRSTIVVGEPFDNDGLYQLRQMVPNKPRKTLRQLLGGKRSL